MNEFHIIYEKTKAWTKQHPIISTCILICGGYFFYNLTFSFLYPKPRIESNKKGANKLNGKETPKKPEVIKPTNNVDFSPKVGNFANSYINEARNSPNTIIPPVITPVANSEHPFSQKPVPSLLKSEDINISLDNFKGKYLFLIFYSQNLAKKNEIIALNKAISKFESLNVSLVGCSNDNKFSHANLNRTLGKEAINFPLIGDDKKEMSGEFKISFDNTGKNKPTTIVFSPTGEIIQTIDSIDVNTLISFAMKVQS